MNSYLTADEAAASLKLHKKTLLRLIRAGTVPAVRIGRQWRVSSADLAEHFRTAVRQ